MCRPATLDRWLMTGELAFCQWLRRFHVYLYRMMALLDVASYDYEAFLWTRRGCCQFSWGWKSTAYADMSSTAPMIMHRSMHVFDYFVADNLFVSASETAGASSCLLSYSICAHACPARYLLHFFCYLSVDRFFFIKSILFLYV